MDRRNFLASAAAATLSAAAAAEVPAGARELAHLDTRKPEPAAGKRPNVLLLMSDQHKRSCMGAYGDPVAKTPNLDLLASDAVRF